ncbi:hypothetical protein [Methylobacterium sp. J-070]|uniref:hypothetical protein n=1 Tax=Methylobacterium sp. J-070 TaxID=2836650 RepID=UPI001FB9AA04|nr:hypothetical protein [Methylobacterium sp. J-070]MCJ2050864.1 hypothetical protein [Methylobacterium sp. J-070]
MVRAGDLIGAVTGPLRRGTCLLALLAGPAAGQAAGDHLQLCPAGPDAACAANQAEFRAAVPLAYRGDYQAQRNVAFCLQDGCGGGIRRNPALACAWRQVILGSGSNRVDGSDESNARLACAGLDAAQSEIARAQAARIRRGIARVGR